MGGLFGININRIFNPKSFFELEENKSRLEETVSVVRNAFDRPNMDYGDIYNHLISPEMLFLLEDNKEKILGMAAYNKVLLSGIPSLIVEGIAIDPMIQRKGMFREVTNLVSVNSAVVCLRTQNPHMYRALQNYCSQVYPGETDPPLAIRAIRDNLAGRLKCEVDENGVIRGYYGSLFYGKKPHHAEISPLFEKRFGMNIENGDAILVVGVR